MMKNEGSQVLRAVAANASDRILVAVKNLASTAQSVDIQCLPEKGSMTRRSIKLGPGEMTLASTCSDRDRDRSDFGFGNSNGDAHDLGAVGINVSFSGKPGDLSVYGAYVLAKTNTTSKANVGALFFADLSESLTQVYVGIPVGPVDLLPGGEFYQQIGVTNFGDTPSTATISLAKTAGPTHERVAVATLTLPPLSSRHVLLRSSDGDTGIRNSFVIQSSGPPRSVGSSLVTVNTAGALVEVVGKDPQQIENGGGYPWSIDDNTTSTLLLFNSSTETISCDVNISRGTRTWHKSYKLQPNETRTLTINDVIAQRLPDASGQPLTGSATQGEVSWFAAKRNAVVGRLLQSNPFTLEVRSFSCGYNIVLCGALEIQTLLFPSGDYGGGGPITPQMCVAFDPTACYGDQYSNSCSSCSYSWASNNTSIAWVSGSDTNPGGTMYGQKAGQTTGTAVVAMMACNVPKYPPIYVQFPTSVSPIATDTNTSAYCAQTQTVGWYRHVTNQIYDQFNFPYRKAGTVNDQILISSPNDLGMTNASTGTGGSDASGTFPDSYSTCSSYCPGSAGHTVANQFWFFNGVQLPSPTLVDYRCTSITINGR